jgi:hypothetical protein
LDRRVWLAPSFGVGRDKSVRPGLSMTRVRFIDLKKVLAKAGAKPLTMAMGDQSQEDLGDQLK